MAFDPTEISTLVFTEVVLPSTVITTVVQGSTRSFLNLGGTFWTTAGSAMLSTTDLERNCSTISGYTYIPGNPSNGAHRSSSRMFMVPEISIVVFSFEYPDMT
jgi:hypothetical protein